MDRTLFIFVALTFTACGGTLFVPDNTGIASANPPVTTDSTPPPDANSTVSGVDPNLLAASPNTWTWVTIDGMRCGNGNGTGIAVYPMANASRLVVYLQDGPTCTSQATCQDANVAPVLRGFDAAAFQGFISTASGIFNRSDATNPVGQDAFVFVPNCTGDNHSGDNLASYGVHHVGYANLTAALQHIVPSFTNIAEVLLVGSGAGGSGAFYNYAHVQHAFGSVPVVLVDDAGPFLGGTADVSAAAIAAWGLHNTMDPNCSKCLPENGGDTLNLYSFYASTLPNHREALICSTQDATVAQANNFTAKQMQAALANLVTQTATLDPNFHFFYVTSTRHTWLQGIDGSLGEVQTQGVALSTFIAQALSYSANWNNLH